MYLEVKVVIPSLRCRRKRELATPENVYWPHKQSVLGQDLEVVNQASVHSRIVARMNSHKGR